MPLLMHVQGGRKKIKKRIKKRTITPLEIVAAITRRMRRTIRKKGR